MPLCMFAKLIGRDLYEVWLGIVADPDLLLRSANGTDEESQSQKK